MTKVLKDLLARKASRALRVPLVKMEPLVREALKGPKEPQGPKAPQDLRVPRELKEAPDPVGLKEQRAHVAPAVLRVIQVGLRDQRALWDRLDHWDLRGRLGQRGHRGHRVFQVSQAALRDRKGRKGL